MQSPDHPHASSYQDRYGKTRWRYRRAGRTVQLPHAPGHPDFQSAYDAAVEGREKPRAAPVVRFPHQTVPKSFKAAWLILKQHDPEWQALGPDIKTAQTRIAERFLTTPLDPEDPLVFGDVAVDLLRRKHVKALLASRSDTPHAAAHLLRVIRKLVEVALDHEWIENDPTYKLKFRPGYKGWKAWPDDMLDRFEARWPIGTTPRLVYSLALYFGHRRGDVTRVKPADLKPTFTNVVQQKTGKALTLPIHPNLQDVIEAIPDLDKRPFVVMTAWGKPFSAKALGMRMQKWTKAAGIPPGHTLHGLRKTLGKALAENDATTRQLMEMLGHDNIEHAELYSRDAEQKKLAIAAMDKLWNWRRKPAG